MININNSSINKQFNNISNIKIVPLSVIGDNPNKNISLFPNKEQIINLDALLKVSPEELQ